MNNNILGHLTFNYKSILIDEIALEGLEGISLPMLWKRVEHRISAPVTDKLKIRLWDFILKHDSIQLYCLSQPLPVIDIVDRFDNVHDASGDLNDYNDYLDGPYEFCPVEKEYGSSKFYKVRRPIQRKDIKDSPCSKVEEYYGSSLVLVASLEERWHALAPHLPFSFINQLTQPQYCILELVGRGRQNGQTTTGTTNLVKISKDSKVLFYNRKFLQNNDMIRVLIIRQNVAGKGTKSLLLRLKRFHEPTLKSIPRRGFIRNLVDHLLSKPGFCDRTDEICKKGLMIPKQLKKLQKKVWFFNFEEKPVPITGPNKQMKMVKRKIMSISPDIDQSSDSESEEEELPIKCQYKVGVGLLRQAYECFLEAGLKGLTSMEIAQLLGVSFYTCRAICRVLKQNNLVREFFEDKGRQRKARYIAVVATRKIDSKYAEEKEKLLNYLDQNKTTRKRKISSTIDKQDDIPNKKPKEKDDNKPADDNSASTSDNDQISKIIENMEITEVKLLDGLQNVQPKSLLVNKHNLTLRQLRYANGILKVLQDKLCVSGFTTLSNMVAKEINESAMAAKSMKAFLQKLITDGYIKVFSVKWPKEDRYSTLICSAVVKDRDPIIIAKCKEIRLKSIAKSDGIKKPKAKLIRKTCLFKSWPRYTKIQKLHECLTDFAFFTPKTSVPHTFSEGFVLIADFISSLTVQFVVSNINKPSITEEIASKISQDVLQLKLSEAPKDLCSELLKSNSFQTTVKENLKILGVLGLIQLVYSPSIPSSDYQNSSLFSFLIYVNRNAKIVDTTGKWPRKGADKKKIEICFKFESHADVKKYWEQVFDISTNTTITVSDRQKKKRVLPPVHLQKEVAQFDIGVRYGDENGPCGFDSFLFMDIPWYWKTINPKSVKWPSRRIKSKKHTTKVNVKKTKKKVKKVPSEKNESVKQKNIVIPRLRKSCIFKWTKTEDMILILCKIATSIMSPSPQVGSLRVRNLAAKDLLNIIDSRKSLKLCHLRAKWLENNLTVVHRMESIINYLNQNRNIMEKYQGLLKKIRLRHTTNFIRYINLARIAMLEFVWTISQAIQSKTYTNKIGCIVRSYEELYENYNLKLSMDNQLSNAFKMIDNVVIKEAIIMTIMLSFKSGMSNVVSKRIYAIFNPYPEAVLRTVTEELRKCGVLASKDKNNSVVNKQYFENIVNSNFKISSMYQRRWNCRLSNTFVDTLYSIIDIGLPYSDNKGSPETNCFMCELNTLGFLDLIMSTVPVISGDCGTNILQEDNMSAVEIETKFKLKSGTLGWRSKLSMEKASGLYKDLISNCEKTISILQGSYVLKDGTINNEDEDDIISYLTTKSNIGTTFEELKEKFNYTTEDLKTKLHNLETKHIIKRLGYYENIVILTKFAQSYTFIIENDRVIPTPWLTIDKDMRLEVFFKWADVILNKIFESPGCTITFLSDNCEVLSTRHAQDVCMFLERCQCIVLRNVVKQEIDLFSDVVEPEFENYNEYSNFDFMLAFPTVDMFTKYAYIRKKMTETEEGPII